MCVTYVRWLQDLTEWGDDANNPEHVRVYATEEDDLQISHRASQAVLEVKNRAKEKAVEYKDRVQRKATEIRRRVITGDKSKRVRDYVLEKPVVKTVDRITFLFGILCINATQYILCTEPQRFESFMLMIMPPMLVVRVYQYRKIKWDYFLYDFCYFVNIIAIVTILYKTRWLQQLVFVYSNGPLVWAIVVWRNNMVFHDFSQITSVFIHGFPAILTYVWRWHPSEGDEHTMCDDMAAECYLAPGMTYVYPLVGYFIWQAFYIWLTEVRDKEKLDNDPTLESSVRYMARRGHKNTVARAVLNLCKLMGIMEKNESYDHTTMKTRLIFMTSQLVYTVIFLLPIPFFFRSKKLHAASLVFVYVASIWNGAGFYIEVFSKAYLKQFEKSIKKIPEEPSTALAATISTADRFQEN